MPVITATPDLESSKLRKLASYLAPSTLRIGGTACDGVYFCPDEGSCSLPPAYANASVDPSSHIPTALTHDKVRRVANFADAIGAQIMFCISMGPGPRNAFTGKWTPDNARELINYAKSLPNGDLFTIWEAGNEVDFIGVHWKMPRLLTPARFNTDLKTFADLVDQEDPEALTVAPGNYFLPFSFLGDFRFTADLMKHDPPLDWLSWHLYATQSERCPVSPFPATLEDLFSDDVLKNTEKMARYVAGASNGQPVMNGESASAQCGGQPGVSDTMVDALWYADWLGLMAREGSRMVVRQTLVGTDYGMLDPDTYDPRPTFLVYVMYARTVHRLRLARMPTVTRSRPTGTALRASRDG